MIIKSMSRKEPSFRQLLDYINRDQAASQSHVLTHNLLADPDTEHQIVTEFEDNALFLKARANGNALYHEVLSLPFCKTVEFDDQAKILIDLAHAYLEQRAPEQISFGRVHRDKNHIHLHLVISSNALRSSSRAWLTKARLSQIQKNIEIYKLRAYPQLGSRQIYSNDNRGRTASDRETQSELRTGLPSTRKAVTAQLDLIFAKARSSSELSQMINEAGFKLYKRGSAQSVQHLATGKKFRLKTLKLDQAFENALQRFQTIEARAIELMKIRKDQTSRARHFGRDNDDDNPLRERGNPSHDEPFES